MPTVFVVGPYRFFFVSLDYGEPPHVYIQREKLVAKFWLDPIRLEKAGSFKAQEINRIGRLVQENQQHLLECWHEYFGD